MTAPDPLFSRLATALAGRYTLERELGRGGMAAVYLATDEKLGRQVAIKVLPPEAHGILGPERFEREVRLAARLSHPNIVPVFETGEAGGLLFYAMGYVQGESLQARLAREGPLPIDEALRLVAEIADALQYAHEHDIIHRDIKPANILLARGHAHVADFGIAKAVSDAGAKDTLTSTGMAIGTAEYMSPEQAAGEKRLDARSDVYALAALLYEMLSGEPPFTGPSVQAVVARVIADPPRSLRTIRPTVPPHVEAAVMAGLNKMPADRPPSAKAFVDLLLHPTTEHPVGGHRAWAVRGWFIAAVAFAAVVIVVGFAMTRSKRPPPQQVPPGMVLVHAGDYLVGGVIGRPRHTVALDSFYIDTTEVTVSAYQHYIDSARAAVPWRRQPPDDWPATGVLWSEANDYCRWRLPGGRLPTEDEWEAAARGPQGLTYPWGDEWKEGRANVDSATDTLRRVGSYATGRSPFGLLDMVGNAWEWTATEGTTRMGLPGHIIKGGAFNTRGASATPAARNVFPDSRATLWNTGFRCARSVRP